jgi:hypothetical protein
MAPVALLHKLRNNLWSTAHGLEIREMVNAGVPGCLSMVHNESIYEPMLFTTTATLISFPAHRYTLNTFELYFIVD